MEEDRVLAILSRLVAFDSTSRNSNLPVIAYAEDHLRSLGFRTERVPDPTGTKANLLASIGPDEPTGYILSGHTDVVPVDGQAWTGDPFRLRVEGGRAYGRGACDMKGFVAVCLAGAEDMAAARLSRPLHLALTYDEEVGCVGGRVLAEHLKGRGFAAEGCFVGEPTGMSTVVGHKGKRSVRVAVRGATCHSSTAPLGVNAVEWGARLVAEIRRIADGLAADGARDPLYDVPHSTGHVGVFRGGTALNIVPDRAEIVFEFRTVGADDPDALVAAVERFARGSLEPAMRAVSPGSGFDFDVFAGFPGLDTVPGAPIVALAHELSGESGAGKVSFGTEAGLFSTLAGVPSVVIGPGFIEQAHKADEWIALSELRGCADFVERLVARCAA